MDAGRHCVDTGELTSQSEFRPRRFSTFVEVVQWQADSKPDATALVFLSEGETERASMTFSQLDQRARAIAAVLQSQASVGDRALLLYPSGLDFVSGLIGCLYAGIIPVPASPPRSIRHLGRTQAIVANSGAVIALTDQSTLQALRGRNLIPGAGTSAVDRDRPAERDPR